MEQPKRRYEVQIHIGADNKKAFVGALMAIMFNLEAHKTEDEEVDLVSGGWDSGYSVTARVDTSITGDSYHASLEAYMANPARHQNAVTVTPETKQRLIDEHGLTEDDFKTK